MAHEINFVAHDCHFVFYINWTEISGIENIMAQTGVIVLREMFVSQHVGCVWVSRGPTRHQERVWGSSAWPQVSFMPV